MQPVSTHIDVQDGHIFLVPDFSNNLGTGLPNSCRISRLCEEFGNFENLRFYHTPLWIPCNQRTCLSEIVVLLNVRYPRHLFPSKPFPGNYTKKTMANVYREISIPTDSQRQNGVIMTSQQRHDVIRRWYWRHVWSVSRILAKITDTSVHLAAADAPRSLFSIQKVPDFWEGHLCHEKDI